MKKHEPKFEFKSMVQYPNEKYEEGTLFPNGQHLSHEATAILSDQPRVLKQMEIEDFLSPIQDNRRQSEKKNKTRTGEKVLAGNYSSHLSSHTTTVGLSRQHHQ